ncbi:MAG: Fe-S metabolism protein SufE [Candidatus Marinimicrobia bacterium]|nr:Fe-S metabolism protein SufE [Candidatus Neomarinimicrobiota bacterium]|tara:strand:+ start:184 stop:612 length:429 start_codon:yes stop_codon:yes gene_type:complete
MKKSISMIQSDIISEFSMFDDWTEKYEYLIELGKSVPKIKDDEKKDENLIKGCQSRVWLFVEKKEDYIIYTADSDAIITKGIIALLIRVFSYQKAEDIANSNLHFIDKIGLKEHLSITRANGMLSMLKQMKMYAIALSKTQK